MPTLTISILTYNRSKYLLETLQNLREQIYADHLEDEVAIHVNDNCSPDDTQKRVEEFSRQNPSLRFTFAKNPSNLGFDRNVDLSARASKTPWTWLMGDDDFIRPGSIKFVLEKIKGLPADISFMTILVNVYDLQLKDLLMDFSRQFAKDEVFGGVDDRSAQLYNKYLFVGNHIFRTEKWAQTANLEKYIGSEIVQLYFILYWVGRGEKVAFFNRVCIHARYNNSVMGEEAVYKIFRGCIDRRSHMVYETLPDRRAQQTMLKAFFQPYGILSYKKSEKPGLLPSARDWELFNMARQHYSFYYKFWLLYPLETLMPPAGARLMKNFMDFYRTAKHKLRGK